MIFRKRKSKRYGKWRRDGCMDFCSECGNGVVQPHIQNLKAYNYCPYCGAKMEED